MMMKKQKYEELREKAKAIFDSNGEQKEAKEKDIDKLIEELSIYQIELEMQNDELMQTQQKLEKEKTKFRELYEYAPVAYITVNGTGNILDLNYKAAELFGKPRELFNFNSIFPFIAKDSKTDFRQFLEQLFMTKVAGSQSVVFVGKDEELIYCKINGQVFEVDDGENPVVRITITDIVDEKQKHDDELKLQEIKYSEIFNNTLDALFLFPFTSSNKPGLFAEVNRKACELFSVDYKELLTWSPLDIELNDNIAYLNRAAKELINKDACVFEMTHNLAEDKKIPVEINAQKFKVRGSKWGLILVRDISERKEAEKQLKETNLRLKMAMEVGNLGWWEWDYEKNILFTAGKKPEMLGYNPNEVNFSAQDYIDMIHPDDYEHSMQAMRDHLTGKSERYAVEYRLKTKSGDYKWLYDLGQVIDRAHDGKAKRLMGVVFDISDRKAKEEKIIKSEHDLSLLLQNLDDMVFEHASDTTFVNLWTNNEANLFYPKEEIIGHKPAEIFPQPLSDIILGAIEDARQTGKSAYRTYKGLEKEGKYYNAKVTPYMNEQAGELRFVSLVRDVTERRKANLIIQKQNEELKELNATKDKFFSIISHDLKNPFNTILGFTSELIENFEEIEAEDQIKQLKIVHDSARQNFNLLQNLLVWSRTQSKRMPYKPETIQLEEMIDENYQLYLQTAAAKGVDIVKQPYQGEKIHVFADRAMLNTSVRNLLSNAIKYSHKGGEITIGCTFEDDNKVRIFVKDTGVGIDNEMIPKLFKIDETFSLPGTEKEQGTGLGLILVKEFVEQNNGTIYVESEKGKGSTFSIVLNQKEVKKDELSWNVDYDKLSQKVLNLRKEEWNYFNSEIITGFESCIKSYSSRKVGDFSKHLKTFSQANNLEELGILSDQINEAIGKFDINKLNHCLDDFKKLNVIIEEDMK